MTLEERFAFLDFRFDLDLRNSGIGFLFGFDHLIPRRWWLQFFFHFHSFCGNDPIYLIYIFQMCVFLNIIPFGGHMFYREPPLPPVREPILRVHRLQWNVG